MWVNFFWGGTLYGCHMQHNILTISHPLISHIIFDLFLNFRGDTWCIIVGFQVAHVCIRFYSETQCNFYVCLGALTCVNTDLITGRRRVWETSRPQHGDGEVSITLSQGTVLVTRLARPLYRYPQTRKSLWRNHMYTNFRCTVNM